MHEIYHILWLEWTCKLTCESVWPPFASPYTSSGFANLCWLASTCESVWSELYIFICSLSQWRWECEYWQLAFTLLPYRRMPLNPIDWWAPRKIPTAKSSAPTISTSLAYWEKSVIIYIIITILLTLNKNIHSEHNHITTCFICKS